MTLSGGHKIMLEQPRLVDRDYEDPEGFWWRVRVPEDALDLSMGIPVGPPDLTPLGLPPDLQRTLHNQLHARGLFTHRDLRGRMIEIRAALQATYKTDAQAVTALYV
jgi:hypothetical protein